jgi:hypothetical protein
MACNAAVLVFDSGVRSPRNHVHDIITRRSATDRLNLMLIKTFI